jgi:hypothetical protein
MALDTISIIKIEIGKIVLAFMHSLGYIISKGKGWNNKEHQPTKINIVNIIKAQRDQED